jgi:hypothetical protein
MFLKEFVYGLKLEWMDSPLPFALFGLRLWTSDLRLSNWISVGESNEAQDKYRTWCGYFDHCDSMAGKSSSCHASANS